MKVGEKDDESNDNDDVKDRTIAAGIIKKPTMYHHFVRLKDDRGNILTTLAVVQLQGTFATYYPLRERSECAQGTPFSEPSSLPASFCSRFEASLLKVSKF